MNNTAYAEITKVDVKNGTVSADIKFHGGEIGDTTIDDYDFSSIGENYSLSNDGSTFEGWIVIYESDMTRELNVGDKFPYVGSN